jgi:hypothetical protein
MRRRRVLVIGFLAAAFVFLGGVALKRPLDLAGPMPQDGFTRVPGVVHVHSTLSDGGGTPEEIAAAAREAGLRFVAITDHNNLDAKPFEGEHDGVLVLVGTEVSTTAGHVLGLGLGSDPAFRFSGGARDALDDIRLLGGTAFAAHPSSPREDFRFSGWDLPGGWGVELLNGDSQWRAAGWPRLARTAALYVANPRYALLSSLTPPADTLRRWDGLLAQRDVPGIAGADAHERAPLSKRFAPRFPSYASVFGLVRNYVLLREPLSGDGARDGVRLVDALRRGRSYVAVDAIAAPDGFSFVAETANGIASMGETVPATPAPRLRIEARAPSGARAVLLKDGRPVGESGLANADGLSYAGISYARDTDGPGVYRVEVYVPGFDVPWIVSNPIYVFDETARAEREARAAWPAEKPAPAAAVAIDGFTPGSTFGAEFGGGGSEMDRAVLDPKGGPDGGPAARLHFRLGTPGPGVPYVWCALVSRQARDLSGRQGLVFDIRGDGVYRAWVQVRDKNPATANDGTEWWFASVRTSSEWRRVAVPFSELRSLDPKSDGRLDLKDVQQLVFVLDQGAVKPGTAGDVFVANLGAY